MNSACQLLGKTVTEFCTVGKFQEPPPIVWKCLHTDSDSSGCRRQGTGEGSYLPGNGFNHIHTMSGMERLDVSGCLLSNATHC